MENVDEKEDAVLYRKLGSKDGDEASSAIVTVDDEYKMAYVIAGRQCLLWNVQYFKWNYCSTQYVVHGST